MAETKRALMKKVVFFLSCIVLIKTTSAQLNGFVLTGDAASTQGATWTFQKTINGVTYDLQGILYKPQGNGPFPAVIINHGTGGSILTYSRTMAQKMVAWGYVCIGTNYTHSGGVPCGSPGACDLSEYGASNNNILRAIKCYDILQSLSYVKPNCILTFGHSRGAFLTTALVGKHPQKFSAAGHTAGGVTTAIGTPMPDVAMANGINKPYIIHHGTIDTTVPIEHDRKLDTLLTSNGVIYQFYEYNGYGHNNIPFDSLMLERTKAFFAQYGCAVVTGLPEPLNDESIIISPNPFTGNVVIRAAQKINEVCFYNATGQLLYALQTNQRELTLRLHHYPSGLYYMQVKVSGKLLQKKLVKQ
jgi:dienelactone hydrolase